MKLIQFVVLGDPFQKPRVGVLFGEEILDLASVDPSLPNTLIGILQSQPDILSDESR